MGYGRWMATLMAALAMLWGVSIVATAAGAQEGAVMRVVAPAEEIDESADDVAIEIVAEGVENLGGFQFVLTFDEDVLAFVKAENGLFLSSTGRDVQCAAPTVQGGAIRYSCVTLRIEPAGPDGGGQLVTLHFDPVGSGTTTLALSNTRYVTPSAEETNPATEDGHLTVTGDNGINVLLIVLIGAGAVAAVGVVGIGAGAMRRRASSAGSAG